MTAKKGSLDLGSVREGICSGQEPLLRYHGADFLQPSLRSWAAGERQTRNDLERIKITTPNTTAEIEVMKGNNGKPIKLEAGGPGVTRESWTSRRANAR